MANDEGAEAGGRVQKEENSNVGGVVEEEGEGDRELEEKSERGERV